MDGDLRELDEATLARMRGEVAKGDIDLEVYRAQLTAKHTPPMGVLAHVKRHVATQVAQEALRLEITIWAGYWRDQGKADPEIHRRFYFKFGVDIMSAQALREKPAQELTDRITDEIEELLT